VVAKGNRRTEPDRVLPGGVELIGHIGTAAGFRVVVAEAPAQTLDFAMAINSTDDPLSPWPSSAAGSS